jgi:membrane protease YdiL (CAAX protease family)
MASPSEPARTLRPGVIWPVFAGLVIAAVLSIALTQVARTGVVSGAPQLLLADICVWVPLVAAVVWSVRGLGPAGARARLGLEIRLVDVVFGIAAACLARAFDAFLQLGLYGDTGLHPTPLLGGVPVVGLAVLTILGPCILSPVIEELVFRGVLQRGLAARNGGGGWGQASAVLIAAFVFALSHLVLGSTLGTATVFTTFLLGLLVGALTAATGRIGGAIVAHVLFNVIAVVLTWSF